MLRHNVAIIWLFLLTFAAKITHASSSDNNLLTEALMTSQDNREALQLVQILDTDTVLNSLDTTAKSNLGDEKRLGSFIDNLSQDQIKILLKESIDKKHVLPFRLLTRFSEYSTLFFGSVRLGEDAWTWMLNEAWEMPGDTELIKKAVKTSLSYSRALLGHLKTDKKDLSMLLSTSFLIKMTLVPTLAKHLPSAFDQKLPDQKLATTPVASPSPPLTVTKHPAPIESKQLKQPKQKRQNGPGMQESKALSPQSGPFSTAIWECDYELAYAIALELPDLAVFQGLAACPPGNAFKFCQGLPSERLQSLQATAKNFHLKKQHKLIKAVRKQAKQQPGEQQAWVWPDTFMERVQTHHPPSDKFVMCVRTILAGLELDMFGPKEYLNNFFEFMSWKERVEVLLRISPGELYSACTNLNPTNQTSLILDAIKHKQDDLLAKLKENNLLVVPSESSMNLSAEDIKYLNAFANKSQHPKKLPKDTIQIDNVAGKEFTHALKSGDYAMAAIYHAFLPVEFVKEELKALPLEKVRKFLQHLPQEHRAQLDTDKQFLESSDGDEGSVLNFSREDDLVDVSDSENPSPSQIDNHSGGDYKMKKTTVEDIPELVLDHPQPPSDRPRPEIDDGEEFEYYLEGDIVVKKALKPKLSGDSSSRVQGQFFVEPPFQYPLSHTSNPRAEQNDFYGPKGQKEEKVKEVKNGYFGKNMIMLQFLLHDLSQCQTSAEKAEFLENSKQNLREKPMLQVLELLYAYLTNLPPINQPALNSNPAYDSSENDVLAEAGDTGQVIMEVSLREFSRLEGQKMLLQGLLESKGEDSVKDLCYKLPQPIALGLLKALMNNPTDSTKKDLVHEKENLEKKQTERMDEEKVINQLKQITKILAKVLAETKVSKQHPLVRSVEAAVKYKSFRDPQIIKTVNGRIYDYFSEQKISSISDQYKVICSMSIPAFVYVANRLSDSQLQALRLQAVKHRNVDVAKNLDHFMHTKYGETCLDFGQFTEGERLFYSQEVWFQRNSKALQYEQSQASAKYTWCALKVMLEDNPTHPVDGLILTEPLFVADEGTRKAYQVRFDDMQAIKQDFLTKIKPAQQALLPNIFQMIMDEKAVLQEFFAKVKANNPRQNMNILMAYLQDLPMDPFPADKNEFERKLMSLILHITPVDLLQNFFKYWATWGLTKPEDFNSDRVFMGPFHGYATWKKHAKISTADHWKWLFGFLKEQKLQQILLSGIPVHMLKVGKSFFTDEQHYSEWAYTRRLAYLSRCGPEDASRLLFTLKEEDSAVKLYMEAIKQNQMLLKAGIVPLGFTYGEFVESTRLVEPTQEDIQNVQMLLATNKLKLIKDFNSPAALNVLAKASPLATAQVLLKMQNRRLRRRLMALLPYTHFSFIAKTLLADQILCKLLSHNDDSKNLSLNPFDKSYVQIDTELVVDLVLAVLDEKIKLITIFTQQESNPEQILKLIENQCGLYLPFKQELISLLQ